MNRSFPVGKVALALVVSTAVGFAGGGSGHAEAPPDKKTVQSPFDADLASRRAEADKRVGKPDAIVPLLGLLELWNDLEDRASLTDFLDHVINDSRQLPDVRGRASFLRSIVDERTGDFAGGKKRRASIGFVTKWLVLGPFDDEGKAGDREELAPEKEASAPVDLKKEYDGLAGRRVKWRALPESVVSQGIVPLDVALRPTEHVLGYTTTWVHVAQPQWAAVRLGSTGAIKVWVNGRLALERDQYRPVRVDQDSAAVKLEAGWNRVLLKVGAQEGGWAYFFRITGLDGSPIAFDVSTDQGASAGARVVAASVSNGGNAAANKTPARRAAARRAGVLFAAAFPPFETLAATTRAPALAP